jgi:cytochrome b subunit of formate dehydrogenase
VKTVLQALLAALSLVAVVRNSAAQPPAGSHLPPDENNCEKCHGEEALWGGETLRLYVSAETLAHDVHREHGVNCSDCHGGNPSTFEVNEAHATDVGKGEKGVLPFRSLDEVRKVCGNCHTDQQTKLRMGMHAKAGPKDQSGAGTVLACLKCHGVMKDGKFVGQAHGMRSVHDQQSTVFLDHQVAICGGCHEEYLKTYDESVHGFGLWEAGLMVTASCADCHGAHGVYLAADDRSTLNPTKVAVTCGKCHRFIEERVQKSVHGGRTGPGGLAPTVAPGGKERRKPSCTDCHTKHELANPKSTIFRILLPNRCGNCHAELAAEYALTIHGQLTALGYGPAANCSDCHGAHDILPVSDPRSRLYYDPQLPASQSNRIKTCTACHPYVTANFLRFDPHADYTDPQRNPVLHGVYMGFLTLLFSVLGFFAVHSALWSVRSLVHVLHHGRPKPLAPRTVAYLRFGSFHRVAHTFMLLSFLGLALTGLPLKYSRHGWAAFVANLLGGFESTRIWHRVFGVFSFICLGVYVVRMLWRLIHVRNSGTTRRKVLFGPDSPVPNLRDVKDFFKMIRWFVGLGPKPTYEHWSYWEKFDFWGACADIVIIGSTGLILWFPNLFCAFLPGKVLNIAQVIHSTQALLATGFVFAIHFFNTHLRPEKFPMDLSMLTGLVSEDELREERPEYLARLREARLRQIEAAGLKETNLEYIERTRQEGRLDEIRATVPSRAGLWSIMLGGFLALAVGLGLLVGMILAGLGG